MYDLLVDTRDLRVKQCNEHMLKIFCLQFFVKSHFQYICSYYSIALHEICIPAKVKEQPFRGVLSQILFKDFSKIFKLFFLTFSKFRSSCFQETCQWLLSKLLRILTNRILEDFLFMILSLHSVVLFYVYVYDG